MGFLSTLLGMFKKQPSAPAAARAPRTDPGLVSKRYCPTCKRAMLPGAPTCPFCKPQTFGEELPEGTISSQYRPQQGVTGMGGVIVANQLAQQHGAKGFLHVYQGENRGVSVLLAERVITIGRIPDQNVLALNDGGVSSKHCEVRPEKSGFLLVDTGSKNGTFVNDVRVKEKPLVNGDLIAFGNTRIYVGIL